MTSLKNQIIRLLLNRYPAQPLVEGVFVNGHSELMRFLDEGEHTYVIEQVVTDVCPDKTYEHVRIWSSPESRDMFYDNLKKTKDFYSRYSKAERQPQQPKQKHPLVIELEGAVEQRDYEKIVELKGILRRSGIAFPKVSVKELVKKDTRIA